MLVIDFYFPASRLHATPWGRHVNEGAVEWPPSPWRVLRALIATWHLKNRDAFDYETLCSLVTALAEKPPRYWLPPASLGHTRHYMPYLEGSKVRTTKVFDTFVHLAAGEPVRIFWDVAVTPEQERALRLLLENLGYLGRAESLVEAHLAAGAKTAEPNVRPLRADEPIPDGHEIIRLLAPISNASYLAWREKQLAGVQTITAAKGKGKRGMTGSDLPAHITDVLLVDTTALQARGWNLPPGAAYVNYIRSEHSFDIAPLPRRTSSASRPTVARFAVASQVLPRITEAVSVAERIHQSLVKISNGAPVFTGKTAEGRPMTGHRHAHIWCEVVGERSEITRVTLFARDGFDQTARDALKRLRSVWGHGGHDLQLILLGLGDAETFPDTKALGESVVWNSLTPFVPKRHPKNHRDGRPKLDADGWHIGSPAHDLRRLIIEAALPVPAKIEDCHAIQVGHRSFRCLQFRRYRTHGTGAHSGELGYSFRLIFREPVAGPLAFGYGAHFGLGLFVPQIRN
jgi:CRISPR-associated protein Csb2